MFLHHFLLAGFLFAVCIVLVMRRWAASASLKQIEHRRPLRVALLLLRSAIAIFMTALTLLPFVQHEGVFRGLISALNGTRADASPKPSPVDPSLGKDYSGVILFVPVRAKQEIRAPRPAKGNSFSLVLKKPIEIPFDGAYWYFQPPERRPKPDARLVHGDPVKADIHSSNRLPLLMEAHQHLGSPITMNCCSGMQLDVVNADDRFGSMSLEVILIDSTTKKRTEVSLNTLLLRSSAVSPIPLGRAPVLETLTYRIPSSADELQFDEIEVRVKSAWERSLGNAKISIQRFVLLP